MLSVAAYNVISRFLFSPSITVVENHSGGESGKKPAPMSRQLTPQQEIIAAQLTLNTENAINSEVSQRSERALILHRVTENLFTAATTYEG
jgi:hypothetical protein